MSLGRLLVAYLRARPLGTLLSVVLVALGMATVVIVTLATQQMRERLERDAAGVDLVVGAKGSPLQLVLAGIYHLDVPPGNVPLTALAQLRTHRLVAQAIPLSLGDNFRGFRIVGTEPEYLALKGARLARGALWEGPMQAVVGARVARSTGLELGARFVGTHGLAAGGTEHGDDPFTVTGVLAPTGGPIDGLVLTALESVWRLHEGEPADEAERRILEADREITLMLVRYASPLAAVTLPRAIDASDRLQAASPAFESARLFGLAGVGIDVLVGFGLLLLAIAGLSVLIALLQTLSERRRELALLRLLGASRGQLFLLLLGEGVVVTALGVLIGLAAGHLALEAAGAVFAAQGTWRFTGWDFSLAEIAYAIGALGLGAVAAAVPAWRAARVALAEVLAED